MKVKTIILFVGMFLINIILLGCKQSVPNTPEGVASAIVESLASENRELLKKYATNEVLRVVDTNTFNSIFRQAKEFENMIIEYLYVTDQSYDGTVKNVNIKMSNVNSSCKISITLVDQNGKWHFSKIQYR